MSLPLQTLSEINHFAQVFNVSFPDYITNLSDVQITKESTAHNPDAWGDVFSKDYPCHTKEATFISNLLLMGRLNEGSYGGKVPAATVQRRLFKSADYWGNLDDVLGLQVQMKSRPITKSASIVKYALDVSYNSERIKRFPLSNYKTVLASADAFVKSARQYPWKWRKEASINIIQAASDNEVSIPKDTLSYLIKASGVYPKSSASVNANITLRNYIYPEKYKAVFSKAAESDEKDPEPLCEALDMADREEGIVSMYDEGLPMPEEVLFSDSDVEPTKVKITMVTGKSFDPEDLKKLDLEKLDFLGEDTINELLDEAGGVDLEKVTDIFPTLPRNMAKLVEKALADSGIQDETEKEASLSIKWFDKLQKVVNDISKIR